MKSNDFRLGNYIQDTNMPERICRILRLTSGMDFNITYEYNKSCECSYTKERSEFLQPIPLTEEWMLKFGFERIFDWIGLSFNPRMAIRFYGGNSGECDITQDGKFISFKHGHIKYVHQLQNLYFALTGEELTIKS